MILGLEIGMLIAGIIALVTGKIKLSNRRVATGVAARIVGLVLILPLPLALATAVVIGLLKVSQGKPVDPAQMQPTMIIVELTIPVVCALLAIGIALITARPSVANGRRKTVGSPRRVGREAHQERVVGLEDSAHPTEEEDIPIADRAEDAGTDATQQLPQSRPSRVRSGGVRSEEIKYPPSSLASEGSRVVWWVVGGLAACFFCCAMPAGGLLVLWLWRTPAPQPTVGNRFVAGRPVAPAENPPPVQKQQLQKQIQKPPQIDLPARRAPQPPQRAQQPAQQPVLPPIRPAPENRPPRLPADTVEKVLPSTIADVAVGGGGRYLILHLSQQHKLAVFDVSEAKIKGYVPAEGGSVKFAASREKLLVALGGANVLQRWDLATLQREVTTPLPVQYKLSLIAMGSNSDGPLLVASADGVWKAELLFMDIRNLKKLPLEMTGDSHIHIMEGDGVRASADGRVFGLWSIWMGTRTLVLEGKEARGYHENGLPGHLTPGPDGKVIYSGQGRYTNQIRPLGDRSRGAPYCLPAVQGDYYLTVKANAPQGRDKSVRGTLSVHVAGEDRPLITLPEMDLPASIQGPAPGNQTLPADKRIYFIPAANLIVTIPDSTDRLFLHQFNVMEALEKSEIDYLFASSQPPSKAKRGTTYRYQLVVKSKKGGVKYRVDSGPEGMTIADTGLLTWNVPPAFAGKEVDVILTISDRTGQEIFHNFRILME